MTQIQTFGMNAPVRTNAQGSSKNQTEEEQIAAMFAGIMQDAASSQENFLASPDKKTDTKDDVLGLVGGTDKKTDSKASYEAMSSEKSKRPEKIESKPVTNEKKADQTSAVTDTAEKVYGEIKETYGVTDEELEAAMETLGLSMVDLLDTSKLAALVSNLTNTDNVVALVSDPTFTDLLSTVNDMIVDLQKSENIAPADFKLLLSDINASLQEQFRQDNEDILGNEVVDTLVEDTENVVLAPEMDVEVTAQGENVTDANVQTNVAQTVTTEEKKPDNTESREVAHGSENLTVNRVDTAETSSETTEFEGEDSENRERRPLDSGLRQTGVDNKDDGAVIKNSNDNTDDFAKVINNTTHSEHHVVAADQPMANQPQVNLDITPEVVAPQTTYTYEDIQNLMEQVNGAARAMATTDSHTIQMQLNPENLGRLFMSVTEKQGAVTAQLTVTSEDTRAALQSQLVELRANLENQGIKVEAVEVTVASHEFEQNLENQDATNREMMERQARENNGTELGARRNLSMDNLDELSGVMTEEERIVASMMQMNGQSVDYLA